MNSVPSWYLLPLPCCYYLLNMDKLIQSQLPFPNRICKLLLFNYQRNAQALAYVDHEVKIECTLYAYHSYVVIQVVPR